MTTRTLSTPTGVPVFTARALEAILITIALYSLAGWIYIALNAIVHPDSLHLPLTHLTSWPHEDTFGVLCFAISFASTLATKVLRCRA
jgi:cellobiose-specific phosphotransferase system component IIC